MCIPTTIALGENVTIDGITYSASHNRASNGFTWWSGQEVVSIGKDLTTANIKKSVSFNYSVVIGGHAYKSTAAIDIEKISCDIKECTNLVKIEIPSTIYSIKEGCFADSKSLKQINVSTDNNSFLSEDGILYSNDRSTLIAYPAQKEGNTFTLPSTVIELKSYSFAGCKLLEYLDVSNINTFEKFTFSNCSNLKEIILSPSLVKIGESTFAGCENLEVVDIPISVQEIGDAAFQDCKKLLSIKIPKSVKNVGSAIFKGCTSLKEIIIDTQLSDYSCLRGLDKNVKIVAHSSEKEKIRKYWDGVVSVVGPEIFDLKEYLAAVSFSLKWNGDVKLQEVTFNGKHIEPISKDKYFVKDIGVGTINTLLISYIYGDEIYSYDKSVSTKIPEISIEKIESTQTTLSLCVSALIDETVTISEYGAEGYIGDDNGMISINGLAPGASISLYPYVVYNGSRYTSPTSFKFSTTGMGVSATVTEVGVTTAKLSGSFSKYGATILAYGFSELMESEGLDGLNIKNMERLDPSTVYHVYYGVNTKEGGTYWAQQFRKEPEDRWGQYYSNIRFETAALTWETPAATATSLSSARMMVETNCDAETGTGFEWRRIDAPELVPSTQAPCPVVDGRLVGSLRNLNPETYYKFRPYYTSASDKTYYGEWTGLFTGDANVYFEPEVRTLAESLTDKRTVRLAGYALAGSDDITEQGFQYRAVGKAQAKARTAETWQSVVAKGIKMEATLDDLAYGTTYRYRAYAVTAKGTFYGDEREFSTEAESGIEDVVADTEEGLTVALRENPATGTAWVRITGAEAGASLYRLTSVSGATVAAGILAADGTWQPVELTVPAGLYLLTVGDTAAARTVRLVVR